ncbi:unnamed protein product [Adineta ricciae]|uniref:Uncharacterized protein n=1 Tax=Adineta ricciae TaxID=249248 RepID=A0A813SEA0_ADIRI|nr:unnamed protein product [Adineta ricciae]
MLSLQRQWKTLSLSFADAILTVSMNRPKVNAMSPELLTELVEVFDQTSKEDKVRGVHLRSNLNSTFCAGADLSTVYNLSVAGKKSAIDKFVFETLSRGMTAPLYCSKPVACSLDGHTIAGGLMLALSCDYIAIGTRKPFRIGITGPIVGIPYPLKAVKLVQHQLDPSVGYRLLVDATLHSSSDFPIKCERSESPDDLSRKWLKMICQRPLQDTLDNEQEKQAYFEAVTSDECLQAMKNALAKEKS